jgi:excinuclease ABC subunit A
MPEDRSAEGFEAIRIRGARVHNLRGLDVDIPLNRLVVVTGVSGSGKSSLAFDIVFVEGRRRFLDGLSLHARRFLDQWERPDVDRIEGLPPTVALSQWSGAPGPRSTVGTLTEAYDFLRLLYARAGLPHCVRCGRAIRRQTPDQMVATLLSLGEGRKLILLAPLVRHRSGSPAEALAAVRRAGLIRARVDGVILELGPEDPPLADSNPRFIEAVIDRLIIREGIRPRLVESLDLALKLGAGSLIASFWEEGVWRDQALSTHFACPDCDLVLEELEPRHFSFNTPQGACPTCEGLGSVARFAEHLVVPDRSRSLGEEAIAPRAVLPQRLADQVVSAREFQTFLKRHRLRASQPLGSWPPESLRAFLTGEDGGFDGVLPRLERVAGPSARESIRRRLLPFRESQVCPACLGSRLRPEPRSVTLQGRSIPDLAAMEIGAARAFLSGLVFPPPLDEVGPPLIREIDRRLEFLERVGLTYLNLGRSADTLSSGELQRVRLATQIGSGLVGACYVLDEPTRGLHPRDTECLLKTMIELRDQGNTLLVVEHDEATIRAADWVIDLGPGAGPEGGLVVAAGPPDHLREQQPGLSQTRKYLKRVQSGSRTNSRRGDRLGRTPGWIVVEVARARNLKNIQTRFPLGCLSCVTGVSGSGKSTLVLEVLARAASRRGGSPEPSSAGSAIVRGLDQIDQLIVIDQCPIGRGSRSNPATYTGVFRAIRRVFAQTREARVRGYRAERFGFNVKGGRCESCRGRGFRKLSASWLPEATVPCSECGGRRFNRSTLAVRYRGKSIADVLDLRVDEALRFFDAVPSIRSGLEALHRSGLRYLTLGQPAGSLSGGEAQRVKLAGQLIRPATGRTLFILDEPTSGLHFADVETLLSLLEALADRGHTLVLIEHNLEVIRSADWLVDLGPEGGDRGGRVLAEGPPDSIRTNAKSVTAPYL